jgi:hypothetical protein
MTILIALKWTYGRRDIGFQYIETDIPIFIAVKWTYQSGYISHIGTWSGDVTTTVYIKSRPINRFSVIPPFLPDPKISIMQYNQTNLQN